MRMAAAGACLDNGVQQKVSEIGAGKVITTFSIPDGDCSIPDRCLYLHDGSFKIRAADITKNTNTSYIDTSCRNSVNQLCNMCKIKISVRAFEPADAAPDQHVECHACLCIACCAAQSHVTQITLVGCCQLVLCAAGMLCVLGCTPLAWCTEDKCLDAFNSTAS
jgi:hypothetical protein